MIVYVNSYVHIHPFNGPFSGTTQMSWYQKGKTNMDFTGARESEWQLGYALKQLQFNSYVH